MPNILSDKTIAEVQSELAEYLDRQSDGFLPKYSTHEFCSEGVPSTCFIVIACQGAAQQRFNVRMPSYLCSGDWREVSLAITRQIERSENGVRWQVLRFEIAPF